MAENHLVEINLETMEKNAEKEPQFKLAQEGTEKENLTSNNHEESNHIISDSAVNDNLSVEQHRLDQENEKREPDHASNHEELDITNLSVVDDASVEQQPLLPKQEDEKDDPTVTIPGNKKCPSCFKLPESLQKFLPPRNLPAKYLTRFIACCVVGGALYTVIGKDAHPGGNIYSIYILLIAATLGGFCIKWKTRYFHFPALLGMLITGFVTRSYSVINLNKDIDREWSIALRNLALCIILLRSGLGLDIDALKRLKFTVLRLAFMPCISEAVTVAITAHFLLKLPWLWAFQLGFILGAVSPAVVVPSMLNLQKDGYGVEGGIPTLVMAASSCDDVLAISMFGVFLGITFSTGSMIFNIFRGPLEIVMGISAGLVIGILLWYLPASKTKHEGDTAKDKGDTAKDKGDTVEDEGDTAKDEGDAAKDEGDAAKDEGDTAKDGDTAVDGGGIAKDGDAATDKGDTAKDEGDAAKDEGNAAKDEGDAAKDERDTAKDGDTAVDGGDIAKDGGDIAKNGDTEKDKVDVAEDEVDTPNRAVLIIAFALIFLFGSTHVEFPGAGALGVLCLGATAAYGWGKGKEPVEKVLGVLWELFQPLLFGLIGAEVSTDYLKKSLVGKGIAIMFIALVIRFIVTFIVVSGNNMNVKEKIFCVIAWLPKATVQAAIGSVPLDTVLKLRKGQDLVEQREYGIQILTVAFLAILITAPLGAIGISIAGPTCLKKKGKVKDIEKGEDKETKTVEDKGTEKPEDEGTEKPEDKCTEKPEDKCTEKPEDKNTEDEDTEKAEDKNTEDEDTEKTEDKNTEDEDIEKPEDKDTEKRKDEDSGNPIV